MNKKQKITLLVGIICFVLMSIYPPWSAYVLLEPGIATPRTIYAFFTTPPPTPELIGVRLRVACIDYTRLTFQWILVIIVTSGFILMFKDKKKLHNGDDQPISR